MLNRSVYGYLIEEQTKVTHLFYMDDVKLDARGRRQLEGLLELVRRFSENIGMTFAIKKSDTIEVRRGQVVETDDSDVLFHGQVMLSFRTEDRYTYLGIQQKYDIKQSENKKKTETELIRRVRKILRSQLSA